MAIDWQKISDTGKQPGATDKALGGMRPMILTANWYDLLGIRLYADAAFAEVCTTDDHVDHRRFSSLALSNGFFESAFARILVINIQH